MIQMEFFSPTTLTELVQLLLAFVLSVIIGAERERKLKSAGLRTHTLVGLGAAVFTLVSAYGFAGVVSPDVVVDPSRIAAQIVSGIGFLGAGVIFVRQNAVSGLTTAASIWVTAAVGMACGAGMPLIAIATTVLHLCTVILLAVLVNKIPNVNGNDVVIITYKDGMGVLREILLSATRLGFQASLSDTRQIERPSGAARVEATIRFRGRRPLEELVGELTELRGVSSVHLSQDVPE